MFKEERVKSVVQITLEIFGHVVVLAYYASCYIFVVLQYVVKTIYWQIAACKQIQVFAEREAAQIVALYNSVQLWVFVLKAHHARTCEHYLKPRTMVVAQAQLSTPFGLLEHLIYEQYLTAVVVEIGSKVGNASSLKIEVVHIHIEALAVVGLEVLLGILQQECGLSHTSRTLNANQTVAPVNFVH